MILRAKPKDVTKHLAHNHNPKGCGHYDCLWGYSNNKHAPHSGSVGKPARRKFLARGKKYWKMARET